MINKKDKVYKDFLENQLFYATFVVSLEGATIAYNKSPQIGETEIIVKGFKNVKKWTSFQLIGEQYNINIRENNRVYGQNEKRGCIIVKTNKAFIIGIYPKRMELSPRVLYMDKFSKLYESDDSITGLEKEKYVY
ncbi:hypothetical protein CYY_006759 [Polysphondylium violaceum]|uniref:Profilin n=1 Tax=Polysphondylium violaceum TaxID=133409 RepID=A0A8J4PQ09_9MYCE|nr:hypothetical protein CYY_006759 [Polysphondylium violaceum]